MVSESKMSRANPKSIVLKNVQILENDEQVSSFKPAQLLISRGEIVSLDQSTPIPLNTVEIDANGLVALPSLINSRMTAESLETLDSAVNLAISSGTTCIALESSLKPSNDRVGLTMYQPSSSILIPRNGLDSKIDLNNVCLATGNVSESTADLWREMEVLIRLGHSPVSVLNTCTKNPSRKLGLKKGKLIVGNDADFILFPVKDLKSLILTAPTQTPLVASFVAGSPVYMDSEFGQKWQSANIALYSVNGVAPVEGGDCEFDSITSAVEDFANGNFVVVVDNEDRENEGDLIIAAQHMTPEKMAFLIRYSSGVVCASMTGERLDQLQLPLMVPRDNTESMGTAFTITVDYKHGTTTGISASDRCATVRALANPSCQAGDFARPGHIFPLRYTEGGVLKRCGHTEAAVDLCKMAKLEPVGVICEIALDDGRMARRDDLVKFCRKWGFKMITIADMQRHLS